MLEGIDVLDPDGRALARSNPRDASQVEQHGTQMAGLLVGRGGPNELHGAAPGASVLPIRTAGWQPTAAGGFAVYGRTDQLLAGLERAVDPDADGSALDAARIAVVGVVEPFAAFSDGPLARAVSGAVRLDTLVVAPVGNEGPAGPGYGSVGGPGGAPAALTVGAADGRVSVSSARVVVRAGLRILLDRELPLGGAAEARRALALQVVRPAAEARPDPSVDPLSRFFDEQGFSLVAGRAALLARSTAPADAGRRAADAGAAAVLVDGIVPAGALGIDEGLGIPVIGLPVAAARAAREALALGVPVHVSLDEPAWGENDQRGRAAPFSSHGLAFGGGVKPELTAPGVELLTADVGRTDGRLPRYGTISGSSAAAALVGGAAALVVQARPELDAAALKGRARRHGRTAARHAGRRAGGRTRRPRRRGCRRGGELAGHGRLRRCAGTGLERAVRRVRIRNVTTRRLRVSVAAEVEGIAGVSVTVKPQRLLLRSGAERELALDGEGDVRSTRARRDHRLRSGRGGRAAAEIAIPWAVALPAAAEPLLDDVELSTARFKASDRAPAVLSVRAGGVRDEGGRSQLRPLTRLDVELWRGRERLGLLARLRNVLPGQLRLRRHRARAARRRARPRAVPPEVVAIPPAGKREARSVGFRIR